MSVLDAYSTSVPVPSSPHFLSLLSLDFCLYVYFSVTVFWPRSFYLSLSLCLCLLLCLCLIHYLYLSLSYMYDFSLT